ncbi:phage tail protein [Chitinophaga sp. ARDCPP14]|uniref:phage tail protein n=1 Tax=Chitinophaga sp. ARDCPP14 TaxID=3391139 RepID=UPI003F5210A8
MPFVGEIRIFAGNFAPLGWAFCDGQLLPISENDVLFQLIGTTYGGDGQSVFALPDLRGRVPLHMGSDSSSGLTYQIGEKGGEETVTLASDNLPPHMHFISGPVFLPALGENHANAINPQNRSFAITPSEKIYSTVKSTTKRLAPLQVAHTGMSPAGDSLIMTVQPTGGTAPTDNMQSYLVVNFIISLFGVFPTP